MLIAGLRYVPSCNFGQEGYEAKSSGIIHFLRMPVGKNRNRLNNSFMSFAWILEVKNHLEEGSIVADMKKVDHKLLVVEDDTEEVEELITGIAS
ncbi:hypothetical protein OIU76_029675 [Salix suchowensis]|nr:hypothetical protein OIU76_029675 [Salix suchowensis]